MTLVVVVALTIAAQAAAPSAPSTGAAPSVMPKRVAVMKTDVVGDVDAALAPQITSKLAEEVRAQTHAEVISSDEIVALLKHEKERAIVGECKEQESCLAELANALGAEVIVAAKLTSLSSSSSPGSPQSHGYALAVSAVNAQSAAVVGRVNETWGGDAIGLLALTRPVVTKLFATTSIPKGNVEVVGAVAGSKILVDDEVRGSAELPKVADLLVGGHHVVVQSAEKKPVDRWIIVEEGKTASIAVSQESIDGSIFESWWFWTAAGAGVAVAGAGTAGLIYALQNGGGKTGVNVQLNADSALGGAR